MNSRSKGIPTTAIEFFQELESNNNKLWWADNKSRYESDVRDPFIALLGELGAKYEPWRVYRPHRDTRFAKDKAPYKDFIGAVTQLPSGNGFFVQVSAKGLLLGSGYPMMAPDQLISFRNALDNEKTGAAFAALLNAQQTSTKSSSEVRIFGGRYEPLKRNPKGFAADHPRGEWLRWKGVEVSQRLGSPKWLSTSSAAEKISVLMSNGRAVTDWLDKHVGPSALTPEEIWGR
jgi:uncharacterized protein (TIGR02453 family)